MTKMAKFDKEKYRAKPWSERRKNYESRLTKDGVPIHKIFERLEKEKEEEMIKNG